MRVLPGVIGLSELKFLFFPLTTSFFKKSLLHVSFSDKWIILSFYIFVNLKKCSTLKSHCTTHLNLFRAQLWRSPSCLILVLFNFISEMEPDFLGQPLEIFLLSKAKNVYFCALYRLLFNLTLKIHFTCI